MVGSVLTATAAHFILGTVAIATKDTVAPVTMATTALVRVETRKNVHCSAIPFANNKIFLLMGELTLSHLFEQGSD